MKHVVEEGSPPHGQIRKMTDIFRCPFCMGALAVIVILTAAGLYLH